MNYILGIDLGTSGLKTVLFSENGEKVASSTVEYDLIQPQNGWAEQDPNSWWNATITTVKDVLSKSQINPAQIKGVGISGQMHGLVMLDKNGEVIRNAILWCDGRTSKQCQEITEKIGREKLIAITANPALTGFTAGKILWVRENEPQNYAKCETILLPKDYLRFKLTGKYGAEVSDASGTNLFDIKKRDWSDEILTILDLDKKMFPQMAQSADIAGTISEKASEITGLSSQTIVCYGAGDNAAAAVGTGVVSEGKAFTTIGTSGVIFAHSDKLQIDKLGRVHTFCSAVPDSYTVMSCTLSAGLALKWFRDNFCTSEEEVAKLLSMDSYALIDSGVKNIEIGSDHLIFLPYLMGERSPILDEKARGVFFGLSAIHTKYHMARAIMEGVMFAQKHCLEVINEMGVYPKQMYACGGGGKSEIWRQMMADMYAADVITNQNEEGPALGVAILASVASGIFPNIPTACKCLIAQKGVQAPIENNSKKYEPYFGIYKSLYKNLKTDFENLSKI